MKVLVMGAGGQGAPCASILSRDKDVTEIRIADIDLSRAQKVKEKINNPKISIVKVNAAKVHEIVKAAEGMDVIIDLVTPIFYFNVLKAAAIAKVHYVNTAWEEMYFENYEEKGIIELEAKHKLFNDFAKNGTTGILGCGMTSGYASNVIARYYVDKLDSVESIKIRLAKKDTSISKNDEIVQPFNPGWNPKQAILDFVVPSFKYEDGKFQELPIPFSEIEEWEFPHPIGKMLVSHHSHEEPFSLPHTFAKKGLKYCDFKYYVNTQIAPLVALGLGSEEEIDVKGVKVKPLDVVLSLVPQPGDAFLNEDTSKFDYYDKTKHVSIMLEIIGKKDGEKITYLINVPAMNAPRRKMFKTYGTSLISVALPAVMGAKMAVEGTEKGIVYPQDLDPNRFIELMRASGYENTWEEKVIRE